MQFMLGMPSCIFVSQLCSSCSSWCDLTECFYTARLSGAGNQFNFLPSHTANGAMSCHRVDFNSRDFVNVFATFKAFLNNQYNEDTDLMSLSLPCHRRGQSCQSFKIPSVWRSISSLKLTSTTDFKSATCQLQKSPSAKTQYDLANQLWGSRSHGRVACATTDQPCQKWK